MKLVKVLAIVLAAYVGLVVAFEVLVVVMGKRQADDGVGPDEDWLVITTSAGGASVDTVIGGVEDAGHLYVAANHWPRGWYQRAVANPDVEMTSHGSKAAYHAVPVTGEEQARVAEVYHLPWVVRFLTGFPPQSFLRLDPR